MLLDSMGLMRQVVADSTAGFETARQMIEGVGANAAQLTAGMVEISERLRRMALTAHVQAAQIGEGTGLEVLTAETTRVAARVAEVGSAIQASVTELQSGLKVLREKLEEQVRSRQQQQEELDGPGARCEHELHQFRDMTLNILIEAGESVSEVVKLGKEMQGTPITPALLGSLAALQTDMEQVASKACRLLPAGMKENRESLEEFCRAGYTMQSERRVHDQVVYGKMVNDRIPASTAPGNVELF
jgi:hypothetical protein